MKRRLKTQTFLVIAISSLVPLLFAYIDYYALTEADFLSAYPKFENTDLDFSLVYQKQKFAALVGFSYAFRVSGDLIGCPSISYFPVTFPQVKALILRC